MSEHHLSCAQKYDRKLTKETDRADRVSELYSMESQRVSELMMTLSDTERLLVDALRSRSTLQAEVTQLRSELETTRETSDVFEQTARDLLDNGRFHDEVMIATLETRESVLGDLLAEKDQYNKEKVMEMDAIDYHAINMEEKLEHCERAVSQLRDLERWYFRGTVELGPYNYRLPEREVPRRDLPVVSSFEARSTDEPMTGDDGTEETFEDAHLY